MDLQADTLRRPPVRIGWKIAGDYRVLRLDSWWGRRVWCWSGRRIRWGFLLGPGVLGLFTPSLAVPPAINRWIVWIWIPPLRGFPGLLINYSRHPTDVSRAMHAMHRAPSLRHQSRHRDSPYDGVRMTSRTSHEKPSAKGSRVTASPGADSSGRTTSMTAIPVVLRTPSLSTRATMTK